MTYKLTVTDTTTTLAVTESPVTITEQVTGIQGLKGDRGRGYDLTSTTSRTVTIGSTVIFTTLDKDGNSSQGAYFSGAQIIGIVAGDSTKYFYGNISNLPTTGITVDVTSVSVFGGFTASSWNFQIAGAIGQTGDTGSSGVIGVDTGELTNTGTSTSAQLGLATAGTAGTYSLVTTDTFGRVVTGGDAPVPSASLITTGTLPIGQGGTNVATGLTVLNGANLTAATVTSAKLESVTGTGTTVVTNTNPTITSLNASGTVYRQVTSAPASVTTSISAANLLTMWVTSSPATAQSTSLPTATSLTAAWLGGDTAVVEWTYINGGAGIVTITSGTSHTAPNGTSTGSATIAPNTSARFGTRRTSGGGSYISYRLA